MMAIANVWIVNVIEHGVQISNATNVSFASFMKFSELVDGCIGCMMVFGNEDAAKAYALGHDGTDVYQLTKTRTGMKIKKGGSQNGKA